MASVRTSTVLLLLNVSHGLVSPLNFHSGQTERKCFVEEAPDETLLIGNFQTQLYDRLSNRNLPASQDLGMFVEAKDPDDELVLSQRYSSEGTFKLRCVAETRKIPNLPAVQLLTAPLSAGGMLTVHLDMRVGERTKDRLTELQLRVGQLAEQVRQIQREQDNQRLRQKHFREVNRDTGMWFYWWPVARSLYVVALVLWNTSSW